ncbi:hypothetical protein BGZ63DRAFT_371721 [Mariannaea sp. PMI_226]|nr:hypothetical protein BGZ63DRAFT_371721 [Mariannaea sp. PMI_226]
MNRMLLEEIEMHLEDLEVSHDDIYRAKEGKRITRVGAEDPLDYLQSDSSSGFLIFPEDPEDHRSNHSWSSDSDINAINERHGGYVRLADVERREREERHAREIHGRQRGQRESRERERDQGREDDERRERRRQRERHHVERAERRRQGVQDDRVRVSANRQAFVRRRQHHRPISQLIQTIRYIWRAR